ncbi:hypothetical protein [Anatilimnocola floriformis]|uniref:hypothetical protein n=1 Tax=Anatilimnocola floriformis TaxID=2948575 RepID=UPI0020C382E6|nr:hypothetical protein [Anatilimnocola floriformis]
MDVKFRHFEIAILVASILYAVNISPVVYRGIKSWDRYATLGWPVEGDEYVIRVDDRTDGEPDYSHSRFRLEKTQREAWILNGQIALAMLAVAMLAMPRQKVITLCVIGAVVGLIRWPPLIHLWLLGGIFWLLIPAYRRHFPSQITADGQFNLRDGLLLTIAIAAALGWSIRAFTNARSGVPSLEWIDRTTASACAILLAFRSRLAFADRQRIAGAVLAMGCVLFVLANTYMLPAEYFHTWWGRAPRLGPRWPTLLHYLTVTSLFPFGLIYAVQRMNEFSEHWPPSSQLSVANRSELQFWSGILLATGGLVVCVACSWLDLPRPLIALLQLPVYVTWLRAAWGTPRA